MITTSPDIDIFQLRSCGLTYIISEARSAPARPDLFLD
jgi:hypothetical protein